MSLYRDMDGPRDCHRVTLVRKRKILYINKFIWKIYTNDTNKAIYKIQSQM